VVGVKSATVGKVVLELLLINLDTKTEVQRYEKELKDSAFTAEFCTGNIVMYGKYNVAIKLDKIYTVYQNVTDVDEIDVVKSVIGK
jgi:hypothetical protein